jgi:transcriptional regulator with XRE-family HTH domain
MWYSCGVPKILALQLADARRFAASGRGRRLRLAARLSLGDVGRSIGTSHVNILRWETGNRQPTSEVGVRWGQFLRSLERQGFSTQDGDDDAA